MSGLVCCTSRGRAPTHPPHTTMALAAAQSRARRTTTATSASSTRASWPTRAAVPSQLATRHRRAANANAADAQPPPPPLSASLLPRSTPDGWRVRPLDTETRAPQAPTWLNDEVRRVATLQSEAFQAPPPENGAAALLLAPLQPLARASFSAEVLDALRGKTKGVAEGSFAVLVVEKQEQPSVQGVVELRSAMDADVIRALRRKQQKGGGGGGSSSNSNDSDALIRQVSAAVAASAAGVAEEAAGAARDAPSSPLPPLEGDASPLSFLDNTSSLSPFPPPPIRRVAYLASMAVDPSARRKGAAKAMLQAAERLAACWGLGLMALHVYADNSAALSLYERDGWREVERESGWWVGLVPGKRARVLMAKRVGKEAREEALLVVEAAGEEEQQQEPPPQRPEALAASAA